MPECRNEHLSGVDLIAPDTGHLAGFELAAGGLCRYPLRPSMAKASTKSQIVATLAEQVVITKKQAAQVLDLVAELAYKQAKNTFTLPGLGKLVLVNRPARTMTMQFGPKKGQTIKVPARRVVKFRVAKAAKDAILGSK
jgi:DNA-binding protein HU-beta